MTSHARPCANGAIAQRAAFDEAVERTLARIRAELERQLKLQQEGRFARACSDPSHTDATNYAICVEEHLEAMAEMNQAVLAVTRAMQNERPAAEDIDNEVLQAAATFAGWLVSRSRRRSEKP